MKSIKFCYIIMTIFNYSSLPIISVSYIIRDLENQAIGVWVTNQETKESVFLGYGDKAIFYEDYFTIDVTEIIDNINENTTLLVSAVDANSSPVYRDIVVFSTRMDTDSDYEQNDESGEYVYA